MDDGENNELECTSEIANLDMTGMYERIGTEGADADYKKVLGALSKDFISSVSVIHNMYKQKKIEQIKFDFDSNDGDDYEMIIIRNRKQKVAEAAIKESGKE